MSRPHGRSIHTLLALVVAAGVLATVPAARAEVSAHAPRIKELQVRLLREEMRERAEMRRERAALLRAHRHASAKGARARAPRPESGERYDAARAAAAARPVTPAGANALAANVRTNDPTGEVAGVGQCETSIAADGANILVAWNDGQGFVTGGDLQGYGYSTNGGATFTDGGTPPKNANWNWNSDPVVVVNEKTHEFWYSALVDSAATINGVGVVKATFSGGAVVWGTPRLIVFANNAAASYDKEWIAVDSTSNTVYVTYTKFPGIGGDQIEMIRSTNGGSTWTTPVALSDTRDPSVGGENGRVQGARVLANNHVAYLMYYSIGSVDADFFKVRKSINDGLTWGGAVVAASFFANYSSGAPGFNRTNGVAFAGLAMDRSGLHPGRVYLTWPEAVDYYADTLGTGGSRNEVEPNDAAANATPFTLGQVLRGAVSASDGFDYWSFAGTQGQTVVFFADSISTSLDGFLRVFCADGAQRLALSAPGPGFTTGSLIVFTLPATGTYYMRMAENAGTAGGYRIVTGVHTPKAADRARDHRDVFVTWSDTGANGSFVTPVRVNAEPAWFDDWLPEVTTDAVGRVYAAWYDWRDAPAGSCASWSNIYLAYSEDGGASWIQRGAVSDASSNWTAVGSNIAPNQGDYLALFANTSSVYCAWSDGRSSGPLGSSPDIYAAIMPFGVVPVTVALVSATAEPGHVNVRWSVSSEVAQATVERRAGDGPWAARATLAPDGDGMIVVDDRDVTPGTTYGYRLAIAGAGGATDYFGATSVDVPAALALAIGGVSPNPAAREVRVTFTLPSAEAARLELVDVSGRQVRAQDVGALGAGRHTIDLAGGAALPPGVYVVRLVQGARALTTRVSVIR